MSAFAGPLPFRIMSQRRTGTEIFETSPRDLLVGCFILASQRTAKELVVRVPLRHTPGKLQSCHLLSQFQLGSCV